MSALFDTGGKIQSDVKVYIISHPKAGRTWLRVMLGWLLCDEYGFAEKDMLDLRALTKAANILPTQFMHDHSAIVDALSYHNLSPDKSGFREKEIVFLIRGIKDLLVSCYFQATKRVDCFRGDIHTFIRDERFGAMKAATFNAQWYAARTVPQRFLTVRYEDLHLNPCHILLKVAEVIGMPSMEAKTVDAAVRYAEFDNMQTLERLDYFDTKVLRAGNIEDKESYKVRRGRVGDYLNYLDKDDLAYIDEIIELFACPFVY